MLSKTAFLLLIQLNVQFFQKKAIVEASSTIRTWNCKSGELFRRFQSRAAQSHFQSRATQSHIQSRALLSPKWREYLDTSTYNLIDFMVTWAQISIEPSILSFSVSCIMLEVAVKNSIFATYTAQRTIFSEKSNSWSIKNI